MIHLLQQSAAQAPPARTIDPLHSPCTPWRSGEFVRGVRSGHDLSGQILTPVLGEKTLTCAPPTLEEVQGD